MSDLRVLVVEDDAIVAAHLERILTQMGYRVAGLAATGEEAIASAGQNMPDVVLMDVRLRGAMSGVEAAVEIRQRWGFPIVYLTAYADDPLIRDALRAEPYGYLTKPVRERELRAGIEMAYYRHVTDRQIRRLNEVLRMVRDVNELLVRRPDAASLLQEAVRILASRGGYAFATVVGLDADPPAAGPGLSFLEAVRSGEPHAAQMLPCATVLRGGGSVVWNELPHELPDDIRRAALSCGVAAIAAIPLRHGERSWGALCVGAGRHAFSQEEVELLEALGADVASALKAIEDDHARREAEARCAASEQRYRDLVENLDDVVYTVDPSGVITFVNSAVKRLFGYEPDELLGTPYTAFVHPDDVDAITDAFRDLLANRLYPSEYRVVAKDGLTRWVRSRSRPVIEAGSVVAIRGVLSDVTERKSLEEQLRRSQRLEALGQLAGGVAHDFNNALQAIVGYLSLALREASPGTRLHDDLKEIERATSRAATLTRQLLAFGPRQSMEAKPHDLNDVVAGFLKMLRRVLGEHIELEFAPASAMPAVNVDPGQIEQAVLNLALNARDAMPAGGTLSIRTELVTVKPGPRMPDEAREGRFVVVRVADTGTGMTEEVRNRAFEPFFTTEGEGTGTGLGLAMVYGIVKQHGGFVDLESEVGRGTTVSLFLPALETPATREETAPSAPPPAGGRETILLAEDETAIRALNVRILTAAGYRVLPAADGDEAIALFDAEPDAVHLAVLDVVMPRRGGFAVYRHLRQRRPSLPVLFSSGYSDDMEQTRLIQEQGLTILRKPFSPPDLLRAIREALERRPPSDGRKESK